MKTNPFEKAECKGRQLLKKYLNSVNTDVTFKDDQYASYDAETDRSIIEIKVRNVASTTYPDFILESHKVKELLKLKGDKKALYVNFFSDGKMAAWDIEKIFKTHKPIIKSCRATTAVYGGYRNKEVYMITLKDAFVTNYITD